MTSRDAYEIIQAFTKEGWCEVKQRREDGGMVLSVEYAKGLPKAREDQIFVAFIMAAEEYMRIDKESREEAKEIGEKTGSVLAMMQRRFG